MSSGETERSLWDEAVMAASLFVVDPIGLGGIVVRSKFGPVRDQWLQLLAGVLPAGAPCRKLPLHAADERLFGGLDLTATLSHGRPIAERGLLAELDGGILIVPSCERLQPALASRLGLVMDAGAVRAERAALSAPYRARFGLVALDESEGADETSPLALLDRLGIRIDLTDLTWRDVTLAGGSEADIAAARERLPAITAPDAILSALCAAASTLGISSLRAPIFALRAAKASAALAGRDEVTEEDAALAALFVLAPRAAILPAQEQAAPSSAEMDNTKADGNGHDRDGEGETTPDEKALTDMILAAAAAALPRHLLNGQTGNAGRVPANAPSGKSGSERTNAARGRPAGVRRGEPGPGAHLSLIETLRAATPWQRIRREMLKKTPTTCPSPQEEKKRRDDVGLILQSRIEVRRDDFRVKRLKARTQTATIFAVDASGSTALQRLAEAKGAIELLLADCYIRRDQVALIAFRGKGADILLPLTRSLTRAKRSLCALAGGGGTPLASGINAAAALAISARRKGLSPLIVLLTDGKANVAADGCAGRERAQTDASSAGKRLRAEGIAAMLVDTSPRPQAQAERLAQLMAARYVPLPYANAATISAAAKLAVKA